MSCRRCICALISPHEGHYSLDQSAHYKSVTGTLLAACCQLNERRHAPTNIQNTAQLVHHSSNHYLAKPHSGRHGHGDTVLHVAAPQPGSYSVSPSQAENTS